MLSFTYVYASFPRRVAAAAIDLTILAILSFFLLQPFLDFLGFREISESAKNAAQSVAIVRAYGLWWILTVVIAWLYFALQEAGAKQGTIGKRIMGVMVFTSSEARLSFRKASLRFGAKLVSIATFGVGLLLPLFNPRHQALHDMICRTVVLQPRPEGAQMGASVLS